MKAMALDENIRYLRKQRGWSQDILADKLGYKSYTTIQKWESGVSEPPLKKAHEIANLFNVDIDVLTKTCMHEEKMPATKNDDGLTKAERHLLSLFRCVPAESQDMVTQMIEAALKSQGLL